MKPQLPATVITVIAISLTCLVLLSGILVSYLHTTESPADRANLEYIVSVWLGSSPQILFKVFYAWVLALFILLFYPLMERAVKLTDFVEKL